MIFFIVCLGACLSICLLVSLLFVYNSIYMSIGLSVCLSVSLSVCLRCWEESEVAEGHRKTSTIRKGDSEMSHTNLRLAPHIDESYRTCKCALST